MLNPGTGKDDARYYAMAFIMAEHMDPGSVEREHFRARALERLSKAVLDESRLRAACRDTNVRAALRLPRW